LKDDFGIGNVNFDFGFNKPQKKKKEKAKQGNKFSLGNDFGFTPLGVGSTTNKEPQVTSTKNDFGMIGLGGMFGSTNKKMKLPKAPKMPTRKISHKQKFEDHLKQQAAENKLKLKYGIKPTKGSAVAPKVPTLSEKIAAFKNKRYEEGLRKKAGIPKDFEKNIAAEKNKAEIQARTTQAAERYAKANEVYDAKDKEWKSKVIESNRLDKLKAKVKKQRRVAYRFTATKEGVSETMTQKDLVEAQRVAGEMRSQGWSVSPIQQIFF